MTLLKSAPDTRPHVEAASPVRWDGRPVRSVEHLAICVSLLAHDGFGIADRTLGSVRRWGQTMRCDEGWIVEVHDGTRSDFARRVYRNDVDYPDRPDGAYELGGFEVFTPYAAAEVLWAWLHAGLPDGFARTFRHLGPSALGRYGLTET